VTHRLIQGSCLCGAIRYEASDAGLAVHCHCSRCRKWHGAAFASVVRVPTEAFRITTGAESLGRYGSSAGVERCFCKICGSSLFTLRPDLGRVHVRLGTIDGDPGVRPSQHIFVGSKASWFEITDSLPQHEELPPEPSATESAGAADRSGPMNVLKPHISLSVADVEASVAFYARLFGARVKKQQPGHASFDLRAPSLFLVLDEKPRTGVNADHFGVLLASRDDLDEAARRLERSGFECAREATKIWLRDPDGNAWEFFFLPDMAREGARA
jgi:catechol 2,3-dioxygenase-like lactoylglutathione lyase family enzyme